MVLVGDHIYGGHGHNKGFPICVELATGKVAWGGDMRNAGTGSAAVVYADGNLYFRYQNGVVMLIEATPDGLPREGLVHDPGRREARAGRTRSSSAASSTCASRTRSTSTTSASRPESRRARAYACRSPG